MTIADAILFNFAFANTFVRIHAFCHFDETFLNF
jgi:hypothetical protein